MTEYKARPEAIKGPAVMLAIMVALLLTIFFFFPKGFLTYFLMGLILIFVPLAYSGVILKITMDDKKIVVVRPFSRLTVRIEDIAFCAVHGLDDGRHLVYAFVKRRHKGMDCVRGVKQKKPFGEIIREASKDDGCVDLDINFNMAKKLPVSFVEDAEALKDRILEAVNRKNEKYLA